jgi:histidine ammonia-lyase
MRVPFFYGSQKLTVQSALSLAAGQYQGVLDEATTRRVLQSQEGRAGYC